MDITASSILHRLQMDILSRFYISCDLTCSSWPLSTDAMRTNCLQCPVVFHSFNLKTVNLSSLGKLVGIFNSHWKIGPGLQLYIFIYIHVYFERQTLFHYLAFWLSLLISSAECYDWLHLVVSQDKIDLFDSTQWTDQYLEQRENPRNWVKI